MDPQQAANTTDAHIVSTLLTRLLETGISADEYRQLSEASDRLAVTDSVIPGFAIDPDALHRLGCAVQRSDQYTVAEVLLYVGLGFAAALSWSMATDSPNSGLDRHGGPGTHVAAWDPVSGPKTAEAVEMRLHDFRRAN